MIINDVIICMGLFEKKFSFSDKGSIIYSNENSVGKTTLIRIILYAMGYNVPGTKGFPLEAYEYIIHITTDKGEKVELTRQSSNIIKYRNGENVHFYILPEQRNQIHRLLYNTENIDILNNILGTYFLDQEKGWTLLNRGKVIGSIHFNIEELIQGLSGRDCNDLKKQKECLEKELIRYEQIFNVTRYKESLGEIRGSLLLDNPEDELDAQIRLKEIELNNVKRELSRIDSVLKSNRQFKKFVEDMNLMIETSSGDLIRVRAENVVGLNDSIDYLIAKRKIHFMEYSKLLKSINQLSSKKKQDMMSMFSVETIADTFDEMLQKFPYGYVKIAEIKNNLKNQLAQIKKQISEKTRKNNSIVNSIYSNVIKYAEELGVYDNVSMNLNYLFTSNIKILSGALLHKTVFSFRLAYILEIKKILGVKLPIILDSPTGKEINSSNIGLMINILKRDFNEHQIIIASIYEYDLPKLNKIVLKNRLLDL